ncbi:hypothetical protein [Bradyrhizobium sp. NP1]|uniref:COG4223 family protein n=1 Tax=Bradyrhizobium sp. NP1 TaxID=3049772 RepID=UPI0025A5225D|nr:hypothetical protein [Bradyrhizobium sp. NP1]WJR78496.1 hypothetical protein QOU61_01390 [Bradyrhizobium sp. NP1]
MVDDNSQDTKATPEAARAKRTPPTIDLEATDVSTQAPATQAAQREEAAPREEAAQRTEGAQREEAAAEAAAASEVESSRDDVPQASAEGPASIPPSAPPSSISPSSISPWVIAPFSGAVAAALVIAVGWMLGWPQVQVVPAAPPINPAAIDDLGKRVASLESRLAKPATDTAAAARLDALDKSVAALRGDVANLRTQSEKLATVARPADASADLSALNERIGQLERTSRTQSAAPEKNAESKPADDLPLRRLVAAALLDITVQQGHPFAALLASARALAPNPDALKPLDAFAATGVPNPFQLNRELLALIPKLTPSAGSTSPESGLIDRLQAGASKLVRIERTDATGNDRNAVVARATAAALRNDSAEARRELLTLPPADRAPAQAWIDKADARDAALSVSRNFASEAMAALAKPEQ